MGENALEIWREKLEALRAAEAISSDPAQKFQIQKQIEETKSKIAELEAEHSQPATLSRRPSSSSVRPQEDKLHPPESSEAASEATSMDRRARETSDASDAREGVPSIETTRAAIESDTSIDLALSGGGIRATLFQLGVLSYLADRDQLKNVKGIVAVSGGSITAGHFAKNWAEATRDREGFVDTAADLVKFLRTNIRDTAAIPWCWTRLLFCWWIRSLSATAFLERAYRQHFGDITLGDIASNTNPSIAFVATDIVNQQRVAMTTVGLLRVPINATDPAANPPIVPADGVPLSLAIAASSCFPPVFRPMVLAHSDLHLNFSDLKETLTLNDGGVTDNLGAGVLHELRKSGKLSAALTLFIDAETPQAEKPSRSPVADVAVMSTAISGMERRRITEILGDKCRFISLATRIPKGSGQDFKIQTLLRTFRTDLDAPTWPEIEALLVHGSDAAADAIPEVFATKPARADRLQTVTNILQAAGRPKIVAAIEESDLKNCARRPLGRLATHFALMTLCLILLLYVGVSGTPRIYKWFVGDIIASINGEPDMTKIPRYKELLTKHNHRISSEPKELEPKELELRFRNDLNEKIEIWTYHWPTRWRGEDAHRITPQTMSGWLSREIAGHEMHREYLLSGLQTFMVKRIDSSSTFVFLDTIELQEDDEQKVFHVRETMFGNTKLDRKDN